jgi:prepilin-type N-terminal cleavage/methylation domain-containing protein
MKMRVRGEYRDAGVSLPEVLVASILMAVVASICVGVVINVMGGFGKTDNDLRGLQDVRTLQERLSRDLLQARGLTSTSSSSQLTAWIDDNGDYLQASTELYRWQLVTAGGSSQRQVQRINVGTGKTEIIARTVVSSTLFVYSPSPADAATVVDVDLQYNPEVGKLSKPRRVNFSVRMRNHV